VRDTIQLRRKLIEDVGRIAEAGEKDDGPTGASEVEHLQLNTVLDRHEPDEMGRAINPLRSLQENQDRDALPECSHAA